jgi:hypothetical protein
VVLYGCEIWSLILEEEHRLWFSENRMVRRIFESKRDEVTGGWRKLHNEELHNLYSSLSIITTIKSRSIRWAGHVGRMGANRIAYRILMGKSDGKRPLRRPWRKSEDNIKMYVRGIGWGGKKNKAIPVTGREGPLGCETSRLPHFL